MRLAEIDAAEANRVANGAVVAGQLRAGRNVLRRHIVTESDAELSRIRRVGMIEEAAVVAAQHPHVELRVEGRICLQEPL